MKSVPFLHSTIAQATDAAFKRSKHKYIVRILVISSLVIYFFETLLMVYLELFLRISDPLAMVLDGLILIVLLFPINYFFVVRPMAREIEAHYRTNQELVKSNEILERFFAISDILIAYLDVDFNFIRVNKAYSATDERPPVDFIGKNHFDLFPDDENKAIFESVVRTGKAYYAVEKPFQYTEHPERGISYWDWSLLPVKNQEDQVVALILVLNNVTDRKKAQLALVDSERRFRGVFNQTFQHSILLDTEGRALLVNQTALDFSGLTQADLKGLLLWQFPWWDSLAGPTAAAEQLMAGVHQAANGIVDRFEQRILSKNGQRAVMDVTIKPVHDGFGAAIMLIYEARDITERNRAIEALRYSEGENKRLYISERSAHEFAKSLRNAVLALSGSLNSDTVLGTLLDHLNKMIPYTSAHILFLDDDEHLVVRLARGEEQWPEAYRMVGKRYEIGKLAFFKPLLEHCMVLNVEDTFLYPGNFFLPVDEYVRCWLGFPLLAGEQLVGICLLEHICPSFFTQERIHWATALTGQAAVSIQNAWLFEQVRDGREHLQALSRRLVEVQENERHLIARELHDEAGQALASLMIGLRRLEHDSSDQSSVIAHSRELKQVTEDVLENLHRLAIDLRPAALDHLGLIAALRQYVDTIQTRHNLPIQFEAVGEIKRLPVDIETAIYRIVQESLTNVVRHAHATRVDILLEKRDGHLVVVVEDNGIGLDPKTPKVNQLGVLGMQERAQMLGGKLTIESSHGKGSTVFLEVPWQFES